MTDKEILDRGYHRYERTQFDNWYVECHFQKRFDDEKGKKYFIDVNKYKQYEHPSTGELTGNVYEYEVNLEPKNYKGAIRILFFAGATLDEVEKQVEELFATGNYEYYEEWEKEDETSRCR